MFAEMLSFLIGVGLGWALGYTKGCSDLDFHHKNQLRDQLSKARALNDQIVAMTLKAERSGDVGRPR